MNEIIEKLEHGLMVCDVTDTTLVHIDKDDAEKILELLKEQEPIKPRSVARHGKNPQIQHFCGRCNAILFHHKQKYCIECGQAAKWN